MRKEDNKSSRGFGFVLFKEESAVERVLSNYENNFVKNKWVDCKSCQTRLEIETQ